MVTMATLIRPPPVDPSKSAMENLLELTQLTAIDPDLFTNTRPLWHPPGARGIYGGAAIAQSLSAAQRTVPDDFSIHSMHCYFVLAGSSEIPIIYHVEHVREGKSFATRTVQARQKGKVIFTTTMSFMKEKSGGGRLVQHTSKMPDVPGPMESKDTKDQRSPLDQGSPFESQGLEILNKNSSDIYTKRTRQWLRVRGKISPAGGHQAHLSALAYMSDSFFIGTVARVHNLWRFNPRRKRRTVDEETIKKLLELDDETLKIHLPGINEQGIKKLRNGETVLNPRPEVGMMVSLDHTIYFHDARGFRADDWMFSEMESPWADDGRGLVMQKIFSRDGKHLATCIQEGVIRLKQGTESKL